jgi:hypothetical protein
MARWAPVLRPERPGLLTGDPAGEPVLRELLESSDGRVRALAQSGLHWIDEKRCDETFVCATK